MLVIFGLAAGAQTILGLDVSHYQSDPPKGPENWAQVKTAGKTFAWAKATEGVSFTDSTFVRNEFYGYNAGVVMGAYHYATPEDNTAIAEADYFLSVAGAYIRTGYLPPVLDLEDPPGGPALSTAFTSAALSSWVQTWMTTVKNATGINPIIYTDGSYAAYLNSSLNTYGLWIADPDGSPTAAPTSIGVWTTWLFKQYSWTGSVNGVNDPANIDLDVFHGDTTAFNVLIGTSVIPGYISNIQSVCPGSQVVFTDQSSSTGTITGYRWAFSGGTPDTSSAKDPVIIYNVPGIYNVKEIVTSTIGTDSITRSGYITVRSTATLPLVETFQLPTFPPTGWTMNFPSPGDSAWELCTSTGYSSSQCMYFPANCGYTDNIAGERQQIYTPDYSFVGVSNAQMRFDVAYEPFNRIYSDTLAVYYSQDCGNTWTNIYLKGGMTLCTTGSTDSLGSDTSGGRGCFVPPDTHAWRTDSVNLASLSVGANVMFSFESRSGWGNIIYIDNINITGATVACSPPSAPVAVSPGTSTEPGSSTASVALLWDTSAGAVTYFPRISQCPYGSSNIVWEDTCHSGNSEPATLSAGNLYRWNISAYSQCGNSGCESSSSNTLYFNIPPVLSYSGVLSFCQGDSVALTTNAGNTVSAARFYWFLNGALIDSTATGVFYAKQSGSYTVAIAYSCGKTGLSNTISVNVIAPPAAPILTASPASSACGPIQLTAASSGCTVCAYDWSIGSTGSVITVSSTGIYHVTAMSGGCGSSPTSVAITINSPPVVSLSVSSTQACAGSPVSLIALGNATSYQWSGNGLQSNSGDSVNAVFFGTGSQTYTVTATLNACTAMASTSVDFVASVSPVISISQTTSDPICAGSQVSFGSNTSNGGSSPIYHWIASDGQTGNGPAFILNNASNGATVKCLLISSANCASPDSVYSNLVTLATQSPQTPTISISAPDTNVCSGGDILFKSLATDTGATPTYTWYVNGQGQVSSSLYTLYDIQGNSSVYCVLSSQVGCVTSHTAISDTIDIRIQTIATASVSISASPDTICAGTSVTFTATPGNAGSVPSYIWQLNGNTVGNNSPIYANTTLQSGDSVSCRMTSSASCVTDSTVLSNVIKMQVYTLSSPSIQLNQCDLAAQNIPSTAYQWYLQGSHISGADSRFWSASQSGYYFVKIQDSLGCTAQSPDTFVDYPACLSSGVQYISAQAGFDIYPDPADHEINLSFSATMGSEVTIVTIDLLGQVVYATAPIHLSAAIYTINIASLPTGTYFLKVIDAKGNALVKKFIKG
jgi:GH25 family lysozyme M1 (1,4-beta-N-acetylmuramidase)